MTRLIIISLLAPFILFLSINAKALTEIDTQGFLKHGILETPYELPSLEVTPDLDHTLLPATKPLAIQSLKSQLFLDCACEIASLHKKLSCRDPPLI